MKTYCYLLKCVDGSFYCGWTVDPARRLWQHQAGKGSRYTRSRLPVQMVYCEQFQDRQQAMRREREIKNMTHAQKFNLGMRTDND